MYLDTDKGKAVLDFSGQYNLRYIGWVSPSWVFKKHWWFFRLRLVNGFGLTILGFQISWWKRGKRHV